MLRRYDRFEKKRLKWAGYVKCGSANFTAAGPLRDERQRVATGSSRWMMPAQLPGDDFAASLMRTAALRHLKYMTYEPSGQCVGPVATTALSPRDPF